MEPEKKPLSEKIAKYVFGAIGVLVGAGLAVTVTINNYDAEEKKEASQSPCIERKPVEQCETKEMANWVLKCVQKASFEALLENEKPTQKIINKCHNRAKKLYCKGES